MVKHFDPSCPQCNKKFHVHHEDLRYAGIKLLCPYCQNEFFVDECETLVEHDGTVLRIRLDRPEKLNILHPEDLSELRDVITGVPSSANPLKGS